MNLDELKDIWKEDTVQSLPEVTLSEQKEFKQPLQAIRKNMLKEFWSSLIVLILFVLSLLFTIKNTKLLIYTISLAGIASILTVYYFWKFKVLYKKIEKPNYSTFQSLLDLNYSLKYYTDLYVSYYISFLPVFLCEFFLIYEFNPVLHKLPIFGLVCSLVLTLIISIVILYFLGKVFYYSNYGKYVVRISDLLKQIDLPYENFENTLIKIEQNDYWFFKSQRFLENKLGKLGFALNIILWSLLVLFSFFSLRFLMEFFLPLYLE